jgi:pyridinium-3,5-bisthiocarboxylic acid mononucleotide nickel chelatase
MKTLYFDCFSGMSGDMVIGALIDACADPIKLEEELKKLQMEEEYELKWKKVIKTGITSTKFDVILTNINHHDHSHQHEEDDQTHDHGHHHDDHHHGHGHHDHHHRTYQDIVHLIEASELSDEVKETSLKIFKKIGEAEGHIHGVPLEKVHFHEVGAVDSIIDIVGTAVLIHQLEIDVIKASPIAVGSGSIHIDHGIYPVPAPATLEMLKEIPIQQTSIKGELTTPTGAAILAVLAEEFCTLPSIKVKAVGYGAGTKTFKDHPNVLRVIIGEETR